MNKYQTTKVDLKGKDMTPIAVCIRFAHGLGDVCQFSVILKHLRKYRPDWLVDFRCGIGKHTASIGLCNRVYHDKESDPPGPYKTIIEPGFWENYAHEVGVPNSKVVNCLKEVFGLDYDPSLGRYEVNVPESVFEKAARYLASIGCKEERIVDAEDADLTIGAPYPSSWCRFNSVIVHFHGNTSPHKKNLAQWQAASICDLAIRAGRVPVILDWDRRSSLPDGKTIFCPGVGPNDIWGNTGTGDAATIAALISLSEAFVGVDSGPGKIASATETPSLICWTGHHPIQFHDPAPNTVHLVPDTHRELPPVRDRKEIGDYFEKAYLFRTYENGSHGLVFEARKWLGEILDYKPDLPATQYVTPNGIGDVVWVLHKIREIAKVEHGGAPIDIILSGDPGHEIDKRCVPFLKRFPFVRQASVMDVPVIQNRENPTDEKGRYRYEPDGVRGCHHFLCANAPLERGHKLEDWLPQYQCDWSVVDEFDWSGTERGTAKGKELGKFVAFYLGPEAGNVDEGHNRGFLWEPAHWIQLAGELAKRGCKIALVGANYDRSYWERYVRPGVREHGQEWADLIGQFEIGETFALLKESRLLIGYQCGICIVHSYFGGNVVSWWRPDGNSIHPHRMVSFDERMATGWLNPKYADRYLGCIYKKESVADIVRVVDERGWLK